jgi:hypothetical protein
VVKWCHLHGEKPNKFLLHIPKTVLKAGTSAALYGGSKT